VVDATLAAAEVIEKDLPHNAPSQSRSPAQRRVDIGDTDDPFCNEMINLPPQGCLQPVGDMPRYFLVKANCPLPDRRIEFKGALNRLL
jgi:hypothetical protein